MCKTGYLDSYIEQLEDLKELVKSTNKMLLGEDSFVLNNINFFTKSFLIISCVYLESYIKDSLMELVHEINDRLIRNKVPHNYIRWRLNPDKDYKDLEQKCTDLIINITKKDLDDYISGNPFRTYQLFLKFGINLKLNKEFNELQEKILFIVTKRNNVAHHNDEASDVSNRDLLTNIDHLIEYIKILDGAIYSYIHP